MTNRISSLALVGTLLVSSAAMAQGFDAQTYHPSPNARNAHWSQASAITPDHLEWGAGLSFNYASNVLVQRDSEGENVHSPIASLLTMNVLGSIGVTGNLDIALDVPLHLLMSGDTPAADTEFLAVDGGFGIGDIRLLPRYRFYSSGFDGVRAGVHLAGELGIVLPTGDTENFQGGGFQLAPKLIATLANNAASSLTLSFGYLMRESSWFEAGELEVDDALTWGIGFTTGVSDSFSFVGDVHGEIGYASVSTGTEAHPIEMVVGGQIHVDNLDVSIGIGRGLSHGFGVPGFRGILAVNYGKATDLDRDGDDILNADDDCPDEAEDFDRYEDEDGCPEPDNDGDGVLDRPDRCDDEAEDLDGFEDEDGCPDPDNDGDLILDVDDACPDEAEDIDLFEDEDGCPEPSRIHLDTRAGSITLLEETEWFDGITSSLTNPANTALEQIAVALNAYPELNLRVVVRSRDRSGDPSRLGISTRRVGAIQTALANEGVDLARIEISPYAFPASDTEGPGYEVELRIAP